jgi:hypothetical protein
MNAEKVLRRLVIVCLAAGIPATVLRAADPPSPEKATVVAHVQPACGAVAGILRTSAGLPLAAATITAARLDGTGIRATISGSDGVYSFADLVPGAYSVTAQAAGYPDGLVASVEVTAGRATRVDVSVNVNPVSVAPATISKAAPSGVVVASAARPANVAAPVTVASAGGIWKRIVRGDVGSWRELAEAHPGPAKRSEPVPLASLNAPPSSALSRPATEIPLPNAPGPNPGAEQPTPTPVAPAPTIPEALQAPDPAPAVDNFTPFAFGDFSWLNGSPRNNPVLDTKFFTPEIRFDTHFMTSFNQPRDHSLGGATESFRSGEFQLEQVSVGGDFHWENVRGRILTLNGLFSTTTPRNDASAGVGQWDVRGAYKYLAEAYGGYHFNVNHGLNVDAGIFVSYIGLFSYYNFDNWTYQPSFVSSNTPWFFNGLRIQWFLTNKLKIEPWIVNGWQSYNRFNGRHGFGGQIMWQPTENIKFVFNNYGNGTDTLGVPARSRLHTDDSVEYRYYHNATSTGITQMAFTLTGDLGCEYGGGVSCTGKGGAPKQAFLGWMAYDRTWWGKDKYAVTIGGGQMNNPGRYLTLLPPINGADAVSGSPYFTYNPGDKAHMWDTSINFQWMPKKYITWWLEGVYRHSDIPYWTGRGGITPPGGNTGAPNQYVCATGGSAGTADLATAQANCGGGPSSIWYPDLRRGQATISAGVMVKF